MSSLAENIVLLTYECTRCSISKPASEFYPDSKRPRGFGSQCKECKNKFQKQKRYELIPDDDVRIINGLRICSTCKEEKSLIFFTADCSGKMGRTYSCTVCLNKKKILRRSRLDPMYKKNKAQKYNYSRYGLTAEDVKNMLNNQLGLCANRGCGKTIAIGFDVKMKDKAQIDHCHETGKVRGLLCMSCNMSLGILENKNKMLGLSEYLNKYRS